MVCYIKILSLISKTRIKTNNKAKLQNQKVEEKIIDNCNVFQNCINTRHTYILELNYRVASLKHCTSLFQETTF